MSSNTTERSGSRRARGRPREFSVNQALEKAIRVFSRRGYQGTSIADLTDEMGLAQGSIYKAFQDKESLFLAALKYYRATSIERIREAIAEGSNGRERLEKAMFFYANTAHDEAGLLGCLLTKSVTELLILRPEAAGYITAMLESNEAFLVDLILTGQSDGSVSGHVDPDATARTLSCLLQGVRIVGKTGRSRQEMQAAVTSALRILD